MIVNYIIFVEGNFNLFNIVKIIFNSFKIVCVVLWWVFMCLYKKCMMYCFVIGR